MHREILRSTLAFALLLAACASDEPGPDPVQQTRALGSSITREHLTGDVYRYGYTLRVGNGPNARLAIHRVVRERAPWLPRPTTGAIMEMHGDFARFTSNFTPMAIWLAQHDIDVWGFDRRWTQAPAEGADLSDFDAMGLEQELDDIRVALAFARGVRLVTDGSFARMTLLGFSRGGQLAYYYAAAEAERPLVQQHIKGLVPLDVYAAPADETLREFYCFVAPFEYDLLAAGEVDTPNGLQILIGTLAVEAPDDPSPISFWDGFTNREAMLDLVGRTYWIFPASPVYHLNGPVLDDDGKAVALRFASEQDVADWLIASPPHQSLRESADTDAMACGDEPLPVDLPLSNIRVPLFVLAAAGGYGVHALDSAAQVSSTDITTLVVRTLPVEDEAEDFGHADLLFSPDAPALAWQPLLAWLQSH